MTGANAEINTTSVRTTHPKIIGNVAKPLLRMDLARAVISVFNPRIEKHIEDVNQQIDENIG